MTNDSGCGIIRVSQPCCSVQGVIAGDNSFSIIHIAPALYGEYCHTASICLDLISWRRDGAGGREKRGWSDGKENSRTERRREMEKRGGRGKCKKKNGKKQKCGSGVLPGSFVNTLQTVFVVELLPESAELSLHDFHTVCVFVYVYICLCNIHI